MLTNKVRIHTHDLKVIVNDAVFLTLPVTPGWRRMIQTGVFWSVTGNTAAPVSPFPRPAAGVRLQQTQALCSVSVRQQISAVTLTSYPIRQRIVAWRRKIVFINLQACRDFHGAVENDLERVGHSSPSRLLFVFAELMGRRHCVTAAEIPDQKPAWCLEQTQENNPIRKLILMQQTRFWSGASVMLPQRVLVQSCITHWNCWT